MLRYQDFGGLADDKAMAKVWLEKQLPPVSIDEILVTPGIHSALVGLLTLLCRRQRVRQRFDLSRIESHRQPAKYYAAIPPLR